MNNFSCHFQLIAALLIKDKLKTCCPIRFSIGAESFFLTFFSHFHCIFLGFPIFSWSNSFEPGSPETAAEEMEELARLDEEMAKEIEMMEYKTGGR